MAGIIQCFVCRGKGRRWTGWNWALCQDCKGTGRVKHCVACAGRGLLWLGGDEYVECMECKGKGGAVTEKIHFVSGGVRYVG